MRLDHIYITKKFHDTATDWKIEQPGIKTDHKMVTVRLTNPNIPYIGKGRWSMTIHILKNKKFIEAVIKHGLEIEENVKTAQVRTEDNNIQIEYEKFKKDIVKIAKKK